MTTVETGHEFTDNPLDILERIVAAHEWPFDRYSDTEMNVGVDGSWTRYQLWCAWRHDHEALQFSCAYDLKVPAAKMTDMLCLLGLVNERLWLGHFDVWADEGLLMFRHTLLYQGGAGATSEQLESLIEVALRECERYFPAVQFVLWGGKTPAEAVALAMLETEGEA